jgi:hypothetical protein
MGKSLPVSIMQNLENKEASLPVRAKSLSLKKLHAKYSGIRT